MGSGVGAGVGRVPGIDGVPSGVAEGEGQGKTPACATVGLTVVTQVASRSVDKSDAIPDLAADPTGLTLSSIRRISLCR